MAKIVYTQMRVSSGATPTNPFPGKSLDAKPPGWGQNFGANPQGVCTGGWLWQKLMPSSVLFPLFKGEV